MSKKVHKTLKQTQQQPITKTICTEKGCKFRGKEARQGVCYSNEGELADWAKLNAHEKQLVAELKVMKTREGKDYVRTLEAYYVTAMMNWQITLDECIRLRRDAAMQKTSRKRTNI